MCKIKNLYTVTDLAAVFRYDPETGVLYRRSTKREWPCGRISRTGHMGVSFRGKDTGVHRIAWALYHGEYPSVGLDHINGNPTDNRICNLRLATPTQNAHNSKRQMRNKVGVKNILRVKCRKQLKWRVSFGIGGKRYYNVHFYCLGEAVKHAAQMRRNFYGEFARAI